MKKLIKYGIPFLLAIMAGCNKSEIYTPPVIKLDSDTGLYTVKTGNEITIAPVVENDFNARYKWIDEDGKTVCDNKSFIFSGDEGVYYYTFLVETSYGKDKAEIRIDVIKPALPVISFAFSGNELEILTGSDYRFAPDIKHADYASFEWRLNGEIVGNEASYLFNQDEPGTCNLVFKVTNENGIDEQSIIIFVVNNLDLNIYFDKPIYSAEFTDRHVFSDRPVYLKPITEGMHNGVYTWYIDGIKHDCKDEIFSFIPNSVGEYKIEVHVSDKSGRSAATTVKVVSHGSESSRFRPAGPASSDFSNRIYEYLPAPGQFINDPVQTGFTGAETDMSAAAVYAEKRLSEEKFISLGAFGGYIVAGFDHSIANSGNENEFDFAIKGNQMESSSEPGIVWVMQDANGNGRPDDIWYELKGSEYGTTGEIRDYAVTYYRPRSSEMNVTWSDNLGNTGIISYIAGQHDQPFYYPAWISDNSYTLRGTALKAKNRQESGTWINDAYGWGYADNFGSDRLSDDENFSAHSKEIYFKISHAVNPDGSPAMLQYIDFVKVQTGVLAESGIIGELSTEIFSFRAL